MRKPADLAYGVEEGPPMGVALVVALQHVLVLSVNLVNPLLLARQAGMSDAVTADIIRLGMVALAAGLLLQATRRGPVGCHYLAPMVFAAPMLAPGFLAVQAGGMPLFWGMTIVAGLVTLVLSSVWGRLRTLIPPELAGLVVFLVGGLLGVAALRMLLQADGTLRATDASLALVTLAVMIAVNVWGKGRVRLFSVMVGMLVGSVGALAVGALQADKLRAVAQLPLLDLPGLGHMAWSFDARFIVPFAVASLACAMVTTAVVTSFQRITDADWVRPDMGSIAAGMRGDGAGTLISGALCTYGQGISPSNAGLVSATGVASRVIAYPAAGLLLLGAVVPAIAGLLIILPVSTLAAAVLFPASFMMISGVQIITSRVLDARRTLVIGLGVLTFILISAAPKALADAPEWLQPIVGTPLVLAMLVALGLNLVFRIGIRRQVDFPVQVGTTTTQQMEDFVTRTAATWGARQDTVGRVKVALVEATEVVSELADRAHPVTLRLAYDEFDIDLTVTWRGEAFDLRETPPTQEDFLQERGHHLMAGFLIRQRTDRATSTCEDGACTLRLRFKQ